MFRKLHLVCIIQETKTKFQGGLKFVSRLHSQGPTLANTRHIVKRPAPKRLLHRTGEPALGGHEAGLPEKTPVLTSWLAGTTEFGGRH